MQTLDTLLDYIEQCTSPYHTVMTSKAKLKAAGFTELRLDEEWSLSAGAYFVEVYGSSLVAFHIGEEWRRNLRVALAHTDFPTLRIKPNPLMKEGLYGKLNVETYGGLILHSWLDRPLSVAGVVVCRGREPFTPEVVPLDVKRPLLTIPSLAIHMNRQVNDGVALNRQKEMLPLFTTWESGEQRDGEWEAFLANQIGRDVEDILAYELSLYPTEIGEVFGLHQEFLNSPRLDNLTSCKACLEGIIHSAASDCAGIQVIALFDNEEIGSRTKQGGYSTVLADVTKRIYRALGASEEAWAADVAGGFMLSVDVAHGLHPNYPEKMDPTNKPVLNKGIVLKIAGNQSYAWDATALAVVKALCEEENIDYQVFVNRSDAVGGSTLGSLVSAQLPTRTLDIGIPLLAMHSARETMGAADQEALESLLRVFFDTNRTEIL